MQLLSIPIKVGAEVLQSPNLQGYPRELNAQISCAVPSSATWVGVGLHVQLPAKAELVLQTKANIQR